MAIAKNKPRVHSLDPLSWGHLGVFEVLKGLLNLASEINLQDSYKLKYNKLIGDSDWIIESKLSNLEFSEVNEKLGSNSIFPQAQAFFRNSKNIEFRKSPENEFVASADRFSGGGAELFAPTTSLRVSILQFTNVPVNGHLANSATVDFNFIYPIPSL